MTEGFRINQNWDRVNQETVKRASAIAVSNVSDVLSRHRGAPVSIRPMHRRGVLSGPAFTVSCRPGDNLMLHKALMMVKKGDVIVVDAGGCLENAIMGELMLARGVQSGIAGIVIYGAIRDVDSISQQDTPVYASGISHRGPYKDGPGEIGFNISLGSMVIEPGDLILGDADGVISIPKNTVNEVLDRAEAKHNSEMKQLKITLENKYDGEWIDKTLIDKGCEFI